ncbi:MAG: tRNA pseudouridine(38-40) synthase TruA [Candidatus Omnitrophica bacterium]|nr:tRNA pseudouridine(38-40) synthase TruA [Candidatus Omnitrophota bacterium]
MQKNILFEVEYIGSNYFGFQIQEKTRVKQVTIQGVLEKALERLFRERIRMVASGRTDRGVHAKAQVVNFKVDTKIPLFNIKAAVNTYLPSDIRVKKVKKVSDNFHARFSVKSKVYRYIIFNSREDSVFWRNSAWHVSMSLDLELMKKGAKRLIGKKDFSIFAKDAKKYKSCKRRVVDISIRKRANLIYIDIEAEGFLRNMARNMVSFLVKIASGKLLLKDLSSILNKKIFYSKNPAPAQGLYLYKVKY